MFILNHSFIIHKLFSKIIKIKQKKNNCSSLLCLVYNDTKHNNFFFHAYYQNTTMIVINIQVVFLYSWDSREFKIWSNEGYINIKNMRQTVLKGNSKARDLCLSTINWQIKCDIYTIQYHSRNKKKYTTEVCCSKDESSDNYVELNKSDKLIYNSIYRTLCKTNICHI